MPALPYGRSTGHRPASERGRVFEGLKPWLAENADHDDQLLTAGQLGLSETAIRVQAHRLHKRYPERVEAEVGQTLTTGASLAEEMQHLFAALASQ
ncbi:hypothetical protein GCM10023213_13600 [Prosthecobacter algae]|uniref:Uncharacterized protein n=1 Tax=Prosthecobacter algae TaxID=1144682 RepID=A0ABP9NYL0_9BACT